MFHAPTRTFLVGGIAAFLAAGGLGGAAWAAHSPTVAAGQTLAAPTTTTTTSTAATTSGHAGTLKAVLDQLVAEGTINSSQEQAIQVALQQHRKAHRQQLGADVRRGLRRAEAQAITKALNLTPKQLHQDRQSGLSIAQIAQRQHVPLQTVSAAIVAAARSDLDSAVAAGGVSSQQEQRALATLQERLPTLLNATPHGRAGATTTSAMTSASSTAAPAS